METKLLSLVILVVELLPGNIATNTSSECWTMQLQYYLICVVLLLLTIVNGQPIFVEKPGSLNVADGDTAEFRCRADASVDAVGWLVNGTSFNQLNNPDIDRSSEQSEDGGPPINILTIVGRSVYNGTTIQCIALVLGGDGGLSNDSTLLIQGPLPSVTDLTATSSESAISLTWTSPFSLDLSYFEVDILYRVEVCKLNGGEALNCSELAAMGQPEYSFTEPADEVFQFIVTPLSPRRDGSFLEGTPSQPVTGFFLGAPFPIPESVITRTVSLDPLNVQLAFAQDAVASAPGRVPDSYSIYGGTVDPGPPLQLECDDTSGAEDGDSVVLQLSCRNLLPDRIYVITVQARNEIGRANSSLITLSTHDIIRFQASNSSSAGQIDISCTFAEGADAVGYFTILYPLTTDGGDPVEYDSTMGNDGTVNTTIRDLPAESYVVVVFDIESNGLPESLAAALPQRVDNVGDDVSNGQRPTGDNGSNNGVQEPNATNEGTYSIVSIDTRVCVTADLDGVAIIHSTSTTDPLKMMRLFALALVSGETSCTDVLPDDQYHVAVFTDISQLAVHTGLVSITAPVATPTIMATVATTPTASILGVIVGVLLVVVAVIAIALLTLVILKFKRHKRMSSSTVPITTSTNTAYETRKYVTGRSIEMKSNSAYETRTVPQHRSASASEAFSSPNPEPVYETVY